MKTLFLFLVASAVACAADEVSLLFPQLDLLDGRKLKNVTVKSYDAKSGDVLVVADDKAMVIPIAQVPAPLADRVKNNAPAAGATTAVVAAPLPPPVTTPLMPTPTPAPVVGEAERPAKGKGKGREVANVLAQHKAAAEERAKQYFQFEMQAGSNAISVNKLSLHLEQPQPVDGWTGRYRTVGKAFYEFYDSLGSFQRGTGSFEVVTEQQKPGDELKVVDFTHR